MQRSTGIAPTHPSGLTSALGSGLLAAVSAFAAVVLSLKILGRVDQAVFIWPVSGAILAVILPSTSPGPGKRFALYLAGAAGTFVGGIAVGMDAGFAAIIAALTAIDLLVTGSLLFDRIASFDDLKQQPNVLRFMLATVLSPSLTGILGAWSVSRHLHVPIATVALTSASADAIGIALVIPVILLLKQLVRLPFRQLKPRRLRPILYSLAFLASVVYVFWQTAHPFLFMVFPPMILLLLELGLEGAVLAAVVLSFISWFATSHGHGPICLSRDTSPQVRLLSLQFFVWVCVVTALPVGAILNERKKAERHSRSSDSINQVLLQFASEVFVLSSMDGTQRHVSSGIRSLTGWTIDEYLSFDRLLTVHPDDREHAESMISQIARGQSKRFRYRILQKVGGWKWVEVNIQPYGDDTVDGYVGALRDISDVVETEEQWNDERLHFAQEQKRLADAEQATQLQLKLRDEFLSSVSHELRSPLTSIYSFSSIVADGLAGEVTADQAEYLAIVLKNVAQLQSMIEDLLTVTQSEEGKLSINLQPVPLTDGIIDVVRNLQANASAKNISLDWKEGHLPVTVIADPVRLHQVLTILLDNALKFTPPHGSIEISVAETSAGFIVTRVKDTGCGIPKDEWARIFEKLYQIKHDTHADTSKAGRNGLGLGLHIAKHLVARQGGQIWVTSKLEEGSVFHFTLPVFHERRKVKTAAAETAPALYLSTGL
jgi:PAS domain S-box-containing protein